MFLNTRYLWGVGFGIVDDIDLYGPYQFSAEEYSAYEKQYEALLQVSAASCWTSDPLFLVSATHPEYELGMWNCGWFRNAYAIDVDGKIYPCHRGPELPSHKYSIGDVRTGAIDYARLRELRLLPASYCVARQIQRGIPPGSEPDHHFLHVTQVRQRAKERNAAAVKTIWEAFKHAHP